MRSLTDQERWVLGIGDVVDDIVELTDADRGYELVARLPHAVLVRTAFGLASELRRRPNAIVRLFETEEAGRRALALFEQ